MLTAISSLSLLPKSFYDETGSQKPATELHHWISLQACSKRGLQAYGTSRDCAVRVPLAIDCPQHLQSEPNSVASRHSSLLLRTIAGIEHARNPSRTASAKSSLEQASRRTREQDALHDAKNEYRQDDRVVRTRISSSSSWCGNQYSNQLNSATSTHSNTMRAGTHQ